MEFIYLLNVTMFSRLFFLFNDEPLNKKKLFYLILLQITPLFIFEANYSLLLLITVIIALIIVFSNVEIKIKKLNLIRFIFLIVLAIIYSVFTASVCSLKINNKIIIFIQSLSHFSILFNVINEADLRRINVITLGLLFLLNEVNLLIRYLFELFKIMPQIEHNNCSQTDKKEYNAGRIIGMLERILIFSLVLINQFVAIGFIIAAKAFTRFKELDNREFAEYVLVGTLLSTLSAITIASIIKNIIKYFITSSF